MKTNKKVIVGALLLAMMIIANVNNALNDYGIRSNSFMNGVVASGSEGSGTENSKINCRSVICFDFWVASVNNVSIAIPYMGQNEKCSSGEDWEDCDACQTDCVP